MGTVLFFFGCGWGPDPDGTRGLFHCRHDRVMMMHVSSYSSIRTIIGGLFVRMKFVVFERIKQNDLTGDGILVG